MIAKVKVVLFIAAALNAVAGARVLTQTKITIGVAAMSPRTIPLLIAQEQELFAKQDIEARIVLRRCISN